MNDVGNNEENACYPEPQAKDLCAQVEKPGRNEILPLLRMTDRVETIAAPRYSPNA
ncbi:MAG: hypothetical protein OEW33_12020 [Nitrospirota bacterium]|nr:hypothetical protein [Nitrospirota bacterium]MDH4361449.1 hypothetical protein [Nitrospirota bacterium]